MYRVAQNTQRFVFLNHALFNIVTKLSEKFATGGKRDDKRRESWWTEEQTQEEEIKWQGKRRKTSPPWPSPHKILDPLLFKDMRLQRLDCGRWSRMAIYWRTRLFYIQALMLTDARTRLIFVDKAAIVSQDVLMSKDDVYLFVTVAL